MTWTPNPNYEPEAWVAAQQMQAGSLKESSHPNVSNWLVHLTGRARKKTTQVPPDVVAMHPGQRLFNILQSGSLCGFPTFYSSGQSTVCFSASDRAGVEHLIRSGHYAPWGLVFSRAAAYEAGAAPVRYVRSEAYAAVSADPLAVSVDPGEQGHWLDEVEWRIVGDVVNVRQLRPLAAIVEDPWWPCLSEIVTEDQDCGLASAHLSFPMWVFDVPRMWWHPTLKRLVELPPLPQHRPWAVEDGGSNRAALLSETGRRAAAGRLSGDGTAGGVPGLLRLSRVAPAPAGLNR